MREGACLRTASSITDGEQISQAMSSEMRRNASTTFVLKGKKPEPKKKVQRTRKGGPGRNSPESRRCPRRSP